MSMRWQSMHEQGESMSWGGLMLSTGYQGSQAAQAYSQSAAAGR
jgi:hypothetical protein